jgi:hypothetical protein
MEPRFGHEFSSVRVHTDVAANQVAAELDANAFTVGRDIYFGESAFAPETPAGAHLIAHELAHVVQQSRGMAPVSVLSDVDDGSEREASAAADAMIVGEPVSVSGPATASVAREEKKGDSIFSTIGDMLSLPGNVMGALPQLDPITSTLGSLGSFQKMIGSDDTAGAISGGLGVGSGILGLSKWMAGTESHAGMLGGIGGLLGAAGSAVDAYSNFDKGETGKGVLDSTKALGGTLSGLAALGGFELSSVAGMGAGSALFGGGGSGLAALGPAGAVIGAGMAGVGLGTYLNDNTSVGTHSVDTMGGLDAMLTDEGERPWALSTLESAEDNWDEGNYLSSIGDYGKLAGFATLGALGGIGGGIVDAGSAAVDAVGDAGSWVADNLNPLDWF